MILTKLPFAILWMAVVKIEGAIGPSDLTRVVGAIHGECDVGCRIARE